MKKLIVSMMLIMFAVASHAAVNFTKKSCSLQSKRL